MFSSEFSTTCHTISEDIEIKEHPEFGFKNKKVKVHGHVCDIYSSHKEILINPFSKTHCVYLCSFHPPRLIFCSNIQVNTTFKHTV